MKRASPRRLGLFLAVSAILIAAAILSHRAPTPAGGPPESRAVSPHRLSTPTGFDLARREEARLRAAGRRFALAFLRYEVGDLLPRVEVSLRALAAPAFAGQLLAAAPRRVGRPPTPARIERLDVSFLARSARRALLSGVARRPDGPEEFSFIFALRGDRWLALGAAE